MRIRLECLNCGRSYEHYTKRLFVDPEAFEERGGINEKALHFTHNPSCPKCSSKKFKLNPLSYFRIFGKMFSRFEKDDDRLLEKLMFEDDIVISKFQARGLGKEMFPSEAIEAYKKKIKEDPKDHDSYLRLGNLFKNSWMFIDSIKFYKKAIELNPNCWESYMNLGSVWLEYANLKEAKQMFDRFMELTKNLKKKNQKIEDFRKSVENAYEEITFRADLPKGIMIEEIEMKSIDNKGEVTLIVTVSTYWAVDSYMIWMKLTTPEKMYQNLRRQIWYNIKRDPKISKYMMDEKFMLWSEEKGKFTKRDFVNTQDQFDMIQDFFEHILDFQGKIESMKKEDIILHLTDRLDLRRPEFSLLNEGRDMRLKTLLDIIEEDTQFPESFRVMRHMDQFLAIDPENVGMIIQKGVLLNQTGIYEVLFKYASDHLKRFPNIPELYLLLAKAMKKTEKEDYEKEVVKALGMNRKASMEFMDVIGLKVKNLTNGKIGRNDPCPCGSGKKYKKCCMVV